MSRNCLGGLYNVDGTKILRDTELKKLTDTLSVADDATITLPAGATGILQVWTEAVYAKLYIVDGTPLIISQDSSNSTVITDTDDKLCIIDGGNQEAIIKNRLGALKTVRYVFEYSLPWSPLVDTPKALWLNRRDIRASVAIPLWDVVGSTSGALTIYNIQNGTSNYRTTATGAWVDGSGETWKVSKFYDLTGNSNHATQTTDGNRPALLFNTDNGWPVVDFTHSSNQFLNGPAGSMFSGLAAGSIIARKKVKSTDGDAFIYYEVGDSQHRFGVSAESDGYEYFFCANGGNQYVTLNDFVLNSVANGEYSISGSVAKIYRNNILQSLGYSYGTPAISNTLTGGRIGKYNTTYANMQLSGIILQPKALSDLQRTNLNTYLNT